MKSSDNKPIRFMAAYDIHCGYELRNVNGKRVKTETHDARALRVMFDFAKDFKPNVFILGGDQLEFGAISSHNNGRPRLVEGLRVQDDMDVLDKLVLRPVESLKPDNKVWLVGNHENRIGRYLDCFPATEGLIEAEKYLNLEKRGWRPSPEETPFRLGKLNFIHGHSIFANGGGKNPAAKLAYNYRRNIVAGHLHTYEVATDVTPADRTDYHTAIIMPAMAKAMPDYMKNRPSNFQQGFMYGYVLPDGNFTHHVVIIADGKFVVNGKIYG